MEKVLESSDSFDLLAGIDHNRLHAAFFNGVFAVFRADDGCALRNQFSVEENLAAFDERSHRHLSGVVVDGDVCICADGEMTFVCQTKHASRIQRGLLGKFTETQNIEFYERQALRKDDVAGDATAVGGNCVNDEGAVVAFGLSQGDTGQRRIDVEASADICVCCFPAAKGFFAGHQVGITAGVVNHEGFSS